MIESSIARRYARALQMIAKEANELDTYFSAFEQFYSVCKSNSSLMEALSNRHLDLSSRLRVVEDVLVKSQAPDAFKNFIKILIQKGRFELFPNIFEAFKMFTYQAQNKVEVCVTTAKDLTAESWNQIVAALSEKMGKTVMLQKKIDPQVLGGLAIRMGGELWDGTLKAHLNRLSAKLQQTGF